LVLNENQLHKMKKPSLWIAPRYDFVHYALCGLYIFLLFLCFGVVIRLITQNRWNLRWQKIFHPLLMTGCLIRATFFGLQPFIMEADLRIDNKLNMILNTLPSFIFFSNYLIILFLWAEIYHYAHEDSHVGIAKLQPIFLLICALMYGIVCTLYVIDFIVYSPDYVSVSINSNPVETTILLFDVFIYALTSLGFILYGVRIYFKFSSVPIYTNTRRQVLRKIEVISMLVSLCFIIRCAVVILGVTTNMSAFWWFDGIYYFLLELLPLVLMLQLLHGDMKRVNKNSANVSTDRTALLNG